MNILFGNYGNQTIAAMQWLYENKHPDINVISVDTGWAAENWIHRVNDGQAFAKQCGFNVVHLQAKPFLQDLIKDRNDFPSPKFQWCAGFLKGLTLLNWLDQHDPNVRAKVILGKRRADSRANFDLPEFIEESEHYGARQVWYPLYNCDNAEFSRLINATRLELLTHRSLECDPCVNSIDADFVRISDNTYRKTEILERQINKTMFEFPIADMIKQAKVNGKNNPTKLVAEIFSMGCGTPFGCGE